MQVRVLPRAPQEKAPPTEPHLDDGVAGQAVIKELKRLAVELDTTQTALVAESLNPLLAKYRKPNGGDVGVIALHFQELGP